MKTYFLFISLLISSFSFSQWEYFSAPHEISANSGDIVPCDDGGFVYCGEFNAPSFTERAIIIEKIDNNGNLEWSNSYDFNGSASGHQLFQTSDHGFLVSAYLSTDNAGSFGIFIKLNASGDILWTKKYTSQDDGYQVHTIEPVGNDEFVGVFNSGDSLHFTRFDANANVLYHNTTQVDSLFSTTDIKQMSTGEFAISGSSMRSTAANEMNRDYLFLKIDAMGNEIWKNSFGTDDVWDLVHGVANCSDGNLLFSGRYQAAPTYLSRSVVIKVDGITGDTLWMKDIGIDTLNESWGLDIDTDGGTGFVITGYSQESTGGEYHPFLTKIDENGNVEWHQTYGNELTQGIGHEVKKCSNGYVIFGIGSDSNGQELHWIIKTNSSGLIDDEELTGENSKKILRVFDLLGRETEVKSNQLQLYLYSDGSTEKVFRFDY